MPLIPRYFDLLLLLIERRREAVHRREIFERVWGDVTVSESALSQAVRTIRRTLDDDPREPRFIRTVSRHGYQFVFPEVIEEEEEDGPPTAAGSRGEASPTIGTWPSTPGSGEWAGADLTSPRWLAAPAGSALAGVVSGLVGGLVLTIAPESTAPLAIVPVLAVIGGACGAAGGIGVTAGLATVERAAPAYRTLALTVGGALGGGLVGGAVQLLTRWGLTALLGFDLPIGGALEGVTIGGTAGFAYALVTRREEDGSVLPRYRVFPHTVMLVALCCGLAALALTLSGRPLVAGTIHLLAEAAEGSRATLAPLARLVGESDFGPVSGAIFGFIEGGMFGLGLAAGLVGRPRGTIR